MTVRADGTHQAFNPNVFSIAGPPDARDAGERKTGRYFPKIIEDELRFKLGSIKGFEEKWFWSLCDTTKAT